MISSPPSARALISTKLCTFGEVSYFAQIRKAFGSRS
jgi:hypothetical protein